jgi:hypothetical protein
MAMMVNVITIRTLTILLRPAIRLTVTRETTLRDGRHITSGTTGTEFDCTESRATMTCRRCDSGNQGTFNGEVAIHLPGLKGLDKPIVLVFPELLVCLHCGLTEFIVPESEARVLREEIGPSTAA